MIKSASNVRLQVSFSAAQSLWLVLPALLAHAHLWVRKAALRLLCLGMSSPALGEPVFSFAWSLTTLHLSILPHRVDSYAWRCLTWPHSLILWVFIRKASAGEICDHLAVFILQWLCWCRGKPAAAPQGVPGAARLAVVSADGGQLGG